MPIQLDTPMAPSVRFTKIGQVLVSHVCHVSVEPLREFGSTKIKMTDDGRERSQDKVTLLVQKGTAQLKEGEGLRAVKTGEEVVLWFQGQRRWSWIEAKRKAGGLQVGDVMRIVYAKDEEGKGAQPRKIWAVEIRRPKDGEETEIVELCEKVYHRIESAPKRVTRADIDAGGPPWEEVPDEALADGPDPADIPW